MPGTRSRTSPGPNRTARVIGIMPETRWQKIWKGTILASSWIVPKYLSKAVDQEQTPFFAAIWFHAPHLPVVAGPEHVAAYRQHDVYTRNYYGCITALDEQVGRLRAKLRELGVAENTMLWFCSDNGPEGRAGKAPGSAGPLRGRKRSLYEGGVRVPGIVEWPGHVRPGTTDVAAVTSDYLPTVLDVLDVTYPSDRPLDGVSLKEVILSGANRSRQGDRIPKSKTDCLARRQSQTVQRRRWKDVGTV